MTWNPMRQEFDTDETALRAEVAELNHPYVGDEGRCATCGHAALTHRLADALRDVFHERFGTP